MVYCRCLFRKLSNIQIYPILLRWWTPKYRYADSESCACKEPVHLATTSVQAEDATGQVQNVSPRESGERHSVSAHAGIVEPGVSCILKAGSANDSCTIRDALAPVRAWRAAKTWRVALLGRARFTASRMDRELVCCRALVTLLSLYNVT